MKEFVFAFLLLGISRGITALAAYNLETGNRRKITSIQDYRQRIALTHH